MVARTHYDKSRKRTKRLLDKVNYLNKGIMLDVGHLLCANMELESQEEACQYIHDILDAHDQVDPNLCKSIKGIHLHQSISGQYAKKMLADPPVLREDYYERFAQVYELLGSIDTHMPWETTEIKKVIERIKPQYLVHELLAKNRDHREKLLKQQMSVCK